jgi:hypothetical protein
MAIDRIPGVGPQNTDIATAVAAAVPTNTSITNAITTNAASSGVTMAAITSAITTNAASAGVTLSAIGTQVANNSPSANNWTVIANSGTGWTTFTFTGISGYKTLRLFAPRMTCASASGIFIRINSDSSTSNYFNARAATFNNAISATSVASNDSIQFGLTVSTDPAVFDLTFEFANATNVPKTVTGRVAMASSGFTTIADGYKGYYVPSSAITSLQVFMGGASPLTGQPIYLLGQN